MTAKQETRGSVVRTAADPFADSDAIPWVREGLLAGLMGSAVVAVFFLARDIANGWPLWTPAALGSALFRGEVAAELPEPELVLVAGYSVMHGAIFMGLGLAAAFLVETNRRLADHWIKTWIWSAVGLFLALELIFVSLAAMFAPGLLAELGAGWVAMANLLAATGMAWFLAERAHARLRSPT